MHKRVLAILTALAGALYCAAASADPPQTAAQPAPQAAPVTVPDLRVSKNDDDFDDYFYFHKQGVSLERAKADMAQCLSYYANTNLFAPAPVHVPIGGEPEKVGRDQRVFPGTNTNQYGIVGNLTIAVILELEIDSDMRHWGNINLRRCMMYKGYKRYGTSKAAGKVLAKGTPEEIVARYAMIASGAVPAAEAIEP